MIKFCCNCDKFCTKLKTFNIKKKITIMKNKLKNLRVYISNIRICKSRTLRKLNKLKENEQPVNVIKLPKLVVTIDKPKISESTVNTPSTSCNDWENISNASTDIQSIVNI